MLLLHHGFALVIHDPVAAGGVGNAPLDPDGLPVHLGLVGTLAHVGEPNLDHGAGLVRPDEGLVGIAPAGHPRVAAEREHECRQHRGLARTVLPGEEG